ncbi:MAG: hypothetical protein GY822_24250 [Deltaproteobacteria bacterium]|nr:hypothetical protein [Deltaproteobacteria bacterium]
MMNISQPKYRLAAAKHCLGPPLSRQLAPVTSRRSLIKLRQVPSTTPALAFTQQDFDEYWDFHVEQERIRVHGVLIDGGDSPSS